MLLHFLVFETHLASRRRINISLSSRCLSGPPSPPKKKKKVFCVLPGEDAHAHVDAHVDAHANAHDDEDDDEDDDDNDADDEALYVITLRASKSSH